MECPPNLNWKDWIHPLFVKPEKYFNLQYYNTCIRILILIKRNHSLTTIITLDLSKIAYSHEFVNDFL